MMRYTPRSELDSRISRLQKRLVAAGMDGALVLQNADLFYFCGTIQQSHLYIPAAGEPLLMTRRSLARARQESRLERIVPIKSARQLLDLVKAHSLPRPKRLGLELDVIPANTYLAYQQLLDGVELLDCSPLIRRVRATKSAYELDLIRCAARVADVVFRAIPALLREGMSEVELAGQVEAIARREGHQGITPMRSWNNEMFYGHLMAGANAAVPSYVASPTGGPGVNPVVAQGCSTQPIRAGEPLLVDYVFGPDGYLIDQTRVFAIGELPADLVRAHQAMLEVQEALVSVARPGVTGGQLWELAAARAAELGLAEHFMGHGDGRVRFVGHGVGIELDELPVLAARQEMPLEAGMVIAVEPKAIFPGRGVVGIENTWVVRPDGLERLTPPDDEIVYV